MIAVDQHLRPDKWIEPIAPVPPLRDDWLATLIRTRDEVKQFVDIWTDLDHVKVTLRTLVKDTTKRVQRRLLGWLGEKSSTTPIIPKLLNQQPPPYDPETYQKVKQGIADEKAGIIRRTYLGSRGDDEDLFT